MATGGAGDEWSTGTAAWLLNLEDYKLMFARSMRKPLTPLQLTSQALCPTVSVVLSWISVT
jgi:hypothetical protein